MNTATAILISAFAALFAAFCLLVYFELRNVNIPPGVDSPAKLRVIHCTYMGITCLGYILERLGLCHQYNFVGWCRCHIMTCKRSVPHGLRIKDLTFSTVPVRVYEPTAASGEKKRGLVYFHGGGWMFGCIDDYDEVCQHISLKSNTTVVSVGYRLAPEHRYPAHLDDCEVATRHFLSIAATDFGVDPCRVAVGGDSAGANLAAALCQRLSKTQDGHLPSPCAQVLIYPALQMADFHLPSYQQNHSVPILFRGRTVFYFLQYLNGNTSVSQQILEGRHVPAELKLRYKKWLDPNSLPPQFIKQARCQQDLSSHDADVYHIVKQGLDPEISPLLAEDDVLRLVPPAFVLTCEFDVLRDDGFLYQKRLRDLGVDVTWEHLPEGFHGVISFFNQGWLTFQSSQRGLDSIVRYVKSL
ncbi:arylacetamide deacetylase-like 4 [Danio rerio]|uniref:Arylacetamide deacetylase-like 4 n=2 Tax=Danio rerio TaxID=7955 RepID=A0A8M1NVX1_DANRE|nr:arylacetamide deacetylase-like 4 [Danio rerio]|eukprot:NP_001166113.1 arylacetamide deacetylase-like 4 [Danio rerio]